MQALYIHVPFCRSKCPYCDFYSVSLPTPYFKRYPQLLLRQAAIAGAGGWHGPAEAVFFGGGTPSLFAPEAIASILDGLRAQFGLTDDAEISLEANPGTLSLQNLTGYRAAGVNRLSLGVQSLQALNLARLGRSHSAAEAIQAVQWARAAGFDNLSLDLMFALPGQGQAELVADLQAFIALQPEHLSCYGLTVEEGTPFYHLHRAGGLKLPDEESYAAQYRCIHEVLTAAGWDHYEISNYARPGRQCRHNLVYWQRGEYLGLGAGAHSFRADGWGERLAVPGDLGRYAEALDDGRDPLYPIETFTRAGAMSETLYLGLRTAAGIDDNTFRRCFGQGVAEAFPQGVRQAGERLRKEEGCWRFDLDGWLLYDHFILDFL